MNNEGVAEIKFNWYCQNCKYHILKGHEQPCNTCLDYPLDYYTRKPVKFEEKEKNYGKKML